MKRLLWLLLALPLAWYGFADKKDTLPAERLPPGTVVLALGDSLTAGHNGATVDAAQSYPHFLAEQTGWRIINGGVSGDTSAQALQRFPEYWDANPRLLLLSIGGNDFLQRIPENETRRNIARIIEQAQQRNMAVVLLAVPEAKPAAALGWLNDHPLYADLAQQHQIHLFAGGWANILAQEALRGDQIHPNAEGYRRFAAALRDYLRVQKWL